MEQSRDIAIADVYQQRTAMWLDIVLNRYSPEQFRRAMTIARHNEPALTQEDLEVLIDSHYARFSYYENLHFQHGLGLIPPEEWQAAIANISGDIMVVPCVKDWWQNERQYWRASFAAEVDTLIAKLNPQKCSQPAQAQ